MMFWPQAALIFAGALLSFDQEGLEPVRVLSFPEEHSCRYNP